MKIKKPQVTGYYCNTCEKLYSPEEVDLSNKLYECGECGTIFSRSQTDNYDHRCPDDGKYGSSVGAIGCPEECGDEEGLEEYTGEVFGCEHCGEIFRSGEVLDEHMEDEHPEEWEIEKERRDRIEEHNAAVQAEKESPEMTPQVTRDVELAGWSKPNLIEFIDQNQVPVGDLTPSKVRKAPKDELIQFILEWEQACRMAAQTAQKNGQNTPPSKGPRTFYEPKNYDPYKPSKDAFRLKRLPTARNQEALATWCVTHGFVNPEFEVDKNGLVMKATVDGTYGAYDLWATGGTYYATAK